MKKQNLYFKYQKLWIKSNLERSHDPSDILIDEVCLKVLAQESLDHYVNTLCDGMILLIKSNIKLEKLKNHHALQQLIANLPKKILTESYSESDLMYLGLLIELELDSKKYDSKFYEFIKSMFYKILDCGQKISASMRHKLKKLIAIKSPEIFELFFKRIHYKTSA